MPFLKEHTHTHTLIQTQSIREGDSGNETQTFSNGSFVTRRSRRPPFVLRLFFLHFTRRLQFPSPFLNLFILLRCYETVPVCVFFFLSVPLDLPPQRFALALSVQWIMRWRRRLALHISARRVALDCNTNHSFQFTAVPTKHTLTHKNTHTQVSLLCIFCPFCSIMNPTNYNPYASIIYYIFFLNLSYHFPV